ncbi:MAG: metal-dependent transcriptional regulator [Lachnospiraceae bacterium]|nr:metal-dependent transcriptional regulator [Lachnospiraceae bacterium]
MKIQESAEDYLEAILIIGEKKEFVRAIDIVNHLGISKPSVSVYLKNLRENGYVLVNDKGHLSLTNEGMEIAQKIYERHKILSAILIALGVKEEIAFKDACKIEHDLSDETFDIIKKHYLEIKDK